MKRAVEIVVLGLLLTLFCLAIGGMGACLDVDEETGEPGFENATTQCKRVVGTALSKTQVYFCHDYARDKCFYVASEGGFLDAPCVEHPIADRGIR